MKRFLSILLSAVLILSCTVGLFTFTTAAEDTDTRVVIDENDPGIGTDISGRPYYPYEGKNYYLNRFEVHDVNFDTERGGLCYADSGYAPPTFVSGFGYSTNICIIGVTCAFDLPELDLNLYDWAKVYITTTNAGAPDANNIAPVFGFTDIDHRNLYDSWWAYGFYNFGPEYGPGDYAHAAAPAMSTAAPNRSGISNGTDWSAYLCN